MHQALITLLAAGIHEKSKTAFYILGGALAAWAVLVSAIGFTRPDFPGERGGSRFVIGISAVLVLAAMSSAVLTASTPAPAAPFAVKQPNPKGTAPAPTQPAQAAAPTSTPAGGAGAVASPRSAASPAAVAIAADPSGQLKFTQTALGAKAGKVAITFTNGSPVPHNFTLLSSGGTATATPTFAGGSKKLTVTLTAGKYKFVCTVPGHAQAGMTGTLTVG